jgi:hypothetical protein
MGPSVFTQIPLVANGNVAPGRFLTLVSGNANFGLAVQASASTQLIVGVSERWTRYAPGTGDDDGYIAVAGENLSYRGPGQIAELQLGGAVSNGNVLLSADADGKGVASAPADGVATYYGAVALQAGVADEYIPVYVLSPCVSL